jgi:large subunit ribosomal protein L6
MSRIGKKPIPVPDKVKVEVKGDLVTVASADGKKKLEQNVEFVTVKVEGNEVLVETIEDSRQARGCHGLYRTLISNMIAGVTTGWTRALQIEGAGFKAELKGKKLVLTVGYTYPREYMVPDGVTLELPKANQIIIKGTSKELVGQTAASIRAVRPPDPYRGKGIRYVGERAVRKVAKGK